MHSWLDAKPSDETHRNFVCIGLHQLALVVAGSPSHHVAPTGQASIAAMQDDDSDMCVVCMEQPCVAGFVHGNRYARS